jgi:hypothetical protein
MKFEFAFLAKSAEITPNGLMFVLAGGFDSISGTSFPVTFDRLTLVARLRLKQEECARDHLAVASISGPKGQLLPDQVKMTFSVPEHRQSPERGNTMTCAFNFNDLVFTEPGDYDFCVRVGDVRVGSSVLSVSLQSKNGK